MGETPTARTHQPGSGKFDGFRDELKTHDRMEETVESLGVGDSLFIANWQFVPTQLVLTADPSGSNTSLGRPAGGARRTRRQDSGQ